MKYESGMITAFKSKKAKKMARGVIASFLGMLVMACSGCGGGGGSATSAPTPASAPQIAVGSQIVRATLPTYSDGRPQAANRLPIQDYGIVIRHGAAPGGIDAQGARDVNVSESGGTYYMHYDGAPGNASWNTVLATSTDLINWSIKGNIMPLGAPGAQDSDCVCYGVTVFDGSQYQLYYTASNIDWGDAPNIVPGPPYTTMKAHAASLAGPWTKDGPALMPASGTYYSDTSSPGQIIQYQGQYLQYFSAAQNGAAGFQRTISIARSASMSGPWTIDSAPILPPTEQIENASIYYQQSTQTYFLFANHVGTDVTDAVWVYWSQDPQHWNPANKAVVVDAQSSNWAHWTIGIPSLIVVGDKLAVFYSGNAQAVSGFPANLNQDIGLAWVTLPIKTP